MRIKIMLTADGGHILSEAIIEINDGIDIQARDISITDGLGDEIMRVFTEEQYTNKHSYEDRYLLEGLE